MRRVTAHGRDRPAAEDCPPYDHAKDVERSMTTPLLAVREASIAYHAALVEVAEAAKECVDWRPEMTAPRLRKGVGRWAVRVRVRRFAGRP